MRKNFFYIFFSCLLSSFITFGIYEKFYTNKTISLKNEFQKQKDNPLAKGGANLVLEDYSSLAHMAGLPDFTRIAKDAVNAVVHVKNYSHQSRENININPFDFFFGVPDRFEKRDNSYKRKELVPYGHGSGVIFSSDGYIVTNHHVIKGADKVVVTLNDGESYPAKIIGSDLNSDIAVLKINPAKSKNLKWLYFADSQNVQVGEWTLSIGNPFKLNSTVTAGIISAKNRNLNLLSEGSSPIESFIQTDAAINFGNSGGALINLKGEVIGINTAKGKGGYSFAIPSNIVKKVIYDIKEYGEVQRVFLGIKVIDLLDEERVEEYNQNNKGLKIKSQRGLFIVDVVKDGAAEKSGLKKGDIIKEIDDKKVENFSSLISFILEKKPGNKVEVKALREGEEKLFKVVLKNMKESNKNKTNVLDLLGVEFRDLTHLDKEEGFSQGLRIDKIKGRGLLIDKIPYLEEEDVLLMLNNRIIKTIKDVELAIGNSSKRIINAKFIKAHTKEVISLSFQEKEE